jgi:putative peptidoglycan lipid II flippase
VTKPSDLDDDDVDQRIAQVGRNSASLAVGTLVSRVLGFVRNYLLTLCVATSLAGDAFNIANTLPNQIYLLISTGLITAIFVPQITRARTMRDGGEDFVNRLLTLVWIVLIGVTVVATALTPWLIKLLTSQKADANAPGLLSLGILFGFWCVPQLFFYGMYATLGQVLNARGRFTAYAWAPVWANVINIAAFAVFYAIWHRHEALTGWTGPMIALFAGGSTLSIVAQGVCLIVPLYRTGFRYHVRFGWRGYGFGSVSKMSAWTLASVAISFCYSWVQTRALTAARAGDSDLAGNSVQYYAFLLFMVPHSVVTTPIVAAAFPGLSKAWADRDVGKVRAQLRQGMTSSALVIIPASIAMIALGVPLIRTLFGGVTGAAIDQVWLVTAAYCVGMFPFGLNTFRQNYFFARADGGTNFWQVVVQMAVQSAAVAIALTCVPARYAVAMIALGQTAAALVGAVIFLYLAREQLGDIALRAQAWLWTRLGLAAVVAGAISYGAVLGCGHVSTAHWFQPFVLVAGALVFCLVFWVGAAALRVTEFIDLVRAGSRRVRGMVARRR